MYQLTLTSTPHQNLVRVVIFSELAFLINKESPLQLG